MARQKREVVIAITKKGIATDFSGFRGGKCFDAAEEIRRRLAALGVAITPESCDPKDEPPPDDEGTQITGREKVGN